MAFVMTVVTIGLVCAAFVGVAALTYFCSSVALAAFPGLSLVVLSAVGYALAGVGRLPLSTAEPIRVFVFAMLLLGAHKTGVGQVMFLFLALPLPICWSKSQPGDEGLPMQAEPEDE
jgi:hypothetical protein